MKRLIKKNSLLSLKSKENFKSLFEKGSFYKENNVGFRCWKGKNLAFYVGYTVSKKQYSKAVDRNLIKRRLKSELHRVRGCFMSACPPGVYLFYYLGNQIPLSSNLSNGIKGVIKKFIEET